MGNYLKPEGSKTFEINLRQFFFKYQYVSPRLSNKPFNHVWLAIILQFSSLTSSSNDSVFVANMKT